MIKWFGKYKVALDQLSLRSYRCDPSLCGEGVCCRIFDIAITLKERDRLIGYFPLLEKFCPWLAELDNPMDAFKLTPCELFIRKQENGLCMFNYQDKQGRCWCAIHSAALEAGENPFAWKPLNCGMWPFLRDGDNTLELDTHTDLPCLQENPTGEPDAELLQMLEQLAEIDEDACDPDGKP